MTKDDPLVLYTSANIEVYPRTQITCSHLHVISNWNLYSVDDETKNETHILNTTQSALYIPRGEFPQGLYRLFVYMSYTQHFEYGFVEGYMYFRLQLPPPNVFIQGGSGRMSNPGTITVDAWTGSYDRSAMKKSVTVVEKRISFLFQVSILIYVVLYIFLVFFSSSIDI